MPSRTTFCDSDDMYPLFLGRGSSSKFITVNFKQSLSIEYPVKNNHLSKILSCNAIEVEQYNFNLSKIKTNYQ